MSVRIGTLSDRILSGFIYNRNCGLRRCCLGLRLLLLIVAGFLIQIILTICHSTPLSRRTMFLMKSNRGLTLEFPNNANAEPFELGLDQLPLSREVLMHDNPGLIRRASHPRWQE